MSDAEWIMKHQLEIKDKEIERLRKENERLRAENERLRDLLKRTRNGVVNGTIVGTARGYLLKKIEEEVGDEVSS